MALFRSLIIILFIAGLMLSCSDGRRKSGDSHRKDGGVRTGDRDDKRDTQHRRRDRVHKKRIKVDTTLPGENKEQKENIEKGLVVEKPFSADEEGAEAEDVVDSESGDAATEPVEEIGTVDDTDEPVEVTAEEAVEEEVSGEAVAEEVVEKPSQPVEELGTVDDSDAWNEETVEETESVDEGEMTDAVGEDLSIFTITHAGEEGDEFILKYQSSADLPITLDQPGDCIRLTGNQFSELIIEDGTFIDSIICEPNSDHLCQPDNYKLINDSILFLWDNYKMEPSDYNDSAECLSLHFM